ncbi:SRPBCC family protein [Actinacidiphila rubida]|uniref:Polyketide cyclase / dehydrase and lipid transport n=1 Tax=Actinacidiphila rubida TaxID=310780 RepID=A0A1H8UY01_9ACTN|nr:SRPBCC family protein [Actinacidiphila rubida]SEP07853.1 Polyketide cyclase / dehydrase and lipid transport [Actinacidiphila rubida]
MLHAPDDRPDIHEPYGSPPDPSHRFCQAQAVVPTAPGTVFALLSAMARWPLWVPGVTGAGPGPGDARAGLLLHGHRVEAVVTERAAPGRFAWSGTGDGVRLYQVWRLTAVEDGTHVVTEYGVTAGRVTAPGALDVASPSWTRRLNALWLAQLDGLAARSADGGPSQDPLP